MNGFAGITPSEGWRALSQVSNMRADNARRQGLGYQSTFYEQEAKRSQDYESRMRGQPGGAASWGLAPQMMNGANDFQGFIDREPQLRNVWDSDFIDKVQQGSGGVGRNSYSVLSTSSGGGIDRGEGEVSGPDITPRPVMETSADAHMRQRDLEDQMHYTNPNRPSGAGNVYNRGDFRTQGDYNNLSDNHKLAYNAADYKRPFGGWDQQTIAPPLPDESTPALAPGERRATAAPVKPDWEYEDNVQGYRGDGTPRISDNGARRAPALGIPAGYVPERGTAQDQLDRMDGVLKDYNSPTSGGPAVDRVAYQPPAPAFDPASVYQPHEVGPDGTLRPVQQTAPRRGFIEPPAPRELPWTPAHGTLPDGSNAGIVSDQLEVRSGQFANTPIKNPPAAFAGVPESIFDRLKGLGRVARGSFDDMNGTEPRFKGPYKTPKQHAQGIGKALRGSFAPPKKGK